MNPTSTVYVVDEDPVSLRYIAAVLQRAKLAVRTFSSAPDCLLAIEGQSPEGCLVLDVLMPAMSGLEFQQYLSQRQIYLPVILVTGSVDKEGVLTAWRQGAFALLEKPPRGDELVARVKQAQAAEAQFRILQVQAAAARERLAGLRPRERQVLDLFSTGYTVKQIPGKLGISVRTTSEYRRKIEETLAVRSLDAAVQVARLAETPRTPPWLPCWSGLVWKPDA